MDLCRRPFAALIAYKGGHSALAQARIENRARCLALGPAQSWRAPGQPPGQNIANQQSERRTPSAPSARRELAQSAPRCLGRAGPGIRPGGDRDRRGEIRSSGYHRRRRQNRTRGGLGPSPAGSGKGGSAATRPAHASASRITCKEMRSPLVLLQGGPHQRRSPHGRGIGGGPVQGGRRPPARRGVQRGVEAETTSPRYMREQDPS